MKKGGMKKPGRWILVVAGLGVLYLLIAGQDGLVSVYRSYTELRTLRREIAAQNRIADSLREVSRRLEGDTAYLEEIAREQLGMAKKNERVFKFLRKK